MDNQEILTGSETVSVNEPEIKNEVMGENTGSEAEAAVQQSEDVQNPRRKKNSLRGISCPDFLYSNILPVKMICFLYNNVRI